MTYPNAANGVKKLFTAQILFLISSIAGVIAAVITAATSVSKVVNAVGSQDLEAGVSSVFGGLVAAGSIGIVYVVIMIVALIIQIIGLAKAGKDENMIKLAFILTLVELLVKIISAVATFSAPTLSSVLSLAASVLQIVVSILIILGISKLAISLGNERIAKSGKVLIAIVLITQILSAIISFIIARALVAAGVMAVIAVVLSIIGYIMYIVFLGRAKNFLATA